jgi:hypothetical protein
MQGSGGGGPGASGEGMVDSHKLVRVLRAMRENPQVCHVYLLVCYFNILDML